MRIERTRRKFTNESNRYDAKRDRLVRCARKLGEQGNAAKVSVTDVTTEMGITRGLFYYYFSGKKELNRAVADTYVSDLTARLNSMVDLQGASRETAIRAIVDVVREWFFDEEDSERPMLHVLKEMSLQEYAYRQAADAIVKVMREHSLLADYGKMNEEMITARAQFVALGILGSAHLCHETTVELQVDATCAALRYRKRRAKSGQGQQDEQG